MKFFFLCFVLLLYSESISSLILKDETSILNERRLSKKSSKKHRKSRKLSGKKKKKHKNYYNKLMELYGYSNEATGRKMFMPKIPGMPGGGGAGPGGGVSAGEIKVDFPKLPDPLTAPININTPATAYPQVVADPQRQKPIVVVPELIYPHKVKRIIVHHNQSFHNYYTAMAHQLNPVYAKMAQINPYYSNIANNSPGFNSLILTDPMNSMMNSLEPHFNK